MLNFWEINNKRFKMEKGKFTLELKAWDALGSDIEGIKT